MYLLGRHVWSPWNWGGNALINKYARAYLFGVFFLFYLAYLFGVHYAQVVVHLCNITVHYHTLARVITIIITTTTATKTPQDDDNYYKL